MGIVNAMAYSIIGDNYILEKRGRAVGAIVASGTIATLICSPVVAAISTFGDWRTAILLLAIPFAVASLAAVALVVPHKPKLHVEVKKESFTVGCKKAFSSVGTVAALLVTMFMWCESNTGYYSVSFFRSQFAFSVTWASTFTLVGKLVGMIGAIAAGLLINRVGRKKMGTVTFLVASILSVTFMFLPTAELSSGLSILNYLFAAMAIAAGGSLILELLPTYRSTVMSLNAVFMNIGMLASSLIAGFVLNNYGFQAVGLALGSLGLTGVVVWVALVKEPCAPKKSP
jgi:predicted MFS family arabinose efflux permease